MGEFRPVPKVAFLLLSIFFVFPFYIPLGREPREGLLLSNTALQRKRKGLNLALIWTRGIRLNGLAIWTSQEMRAATHLDLDLLYADGLGVYVACF
jgi:hypothetical protein